MTRKILVALGAAALASSAFAQMPPSEHHDWPDANGPKFEQKLSPEQKAKFESEWVKTWTLRAQLHRDLAQLDDAMKNHDQKAAAALHKKVDADTAALHAERNLRNDIRGNNDMHGHGQGGPRGQDGGPGAHGGPDGQGGPGGPEDGFGPPPGGPGGSGGSGHPPVADD